jgi:hypothetical protein
MLNNLELRAKLEKKNAKLETSEESAKKRPQKNRQAHQDLETDLWRLH